MTEGEQDEGLAPLPPRSYHVLVTLGNEVMHGYGLIEAFEELTDGRETLLPGSLYQTLARLVDEGMLEAADPPEDAGSRGPQRRYYRITALGRRAVEAEARRRRVLELARERRLSHGEAP